MLFLLAFSIVSAAKTITYPYIYSTKSDTLNVNMVGQCRLMEHKYTSISESLKTSRRNYFFTTEKPSYFSLDYYFEAQSIAKGKNGTGKVRCRLSIDKLMPGSSNQIQKTYYQKEAVVFAQSLDLMKFSDTILLPAGSYVFESELLESKDIFILRPMTDSLSLNGDKIFGSQTVEDLKGISNSSSAANPSQIIGGIPPASYTTVLCISTKGMYPVEQPMLRIPDPDSIKYYGKALPLHPGRNSISIFQNRTEEKEEGSIIVNYYDGLGRKEETVAQNITPGHKDLVTLQEYDRWGRKSHEWLPVVTTQNDGDYVSADSCKLLAYHTYGDMRPFTSPIYETSPLEKIVGRYNPGDVWRSREKSMKINEYTNIIGNDTLNCFHFRLTEGVETTLAIVADKHYSNGSLYVTRMEDEDGKTVFEFKDRSGKTVLERRIESRAAGNVLLSDTYYIYNDLDELCAVLPPAISERLTIGNVSVDLLNKYGYLYKYDAAGNISAKKLPGVAWEYYVYDCNNHLLFSQNGEERSKGEWKFFLPDAFGRTCLQGVCRNEIDPFHNPYLNEPYNKFICTYDGYSEYCGYEFNSDNTVEWSLVEPQVQKVNYYDNYNFMYYKGFPTRNEFEYAAENGFAAKASNAKGLLTGTWKLRSGIPDAKKGVNQQYTYAAMYYDDRSRLIQTVSSNHLGGKSREFFAYDLCDNLLKHQHKQSGATSDTLNSCYTYCYDHAGRLVKVEHQIGDAPKVELVANVYDDLGRLSAKTLHDGSLSMDYAYNIRNWLTAINSQQFKENLHYTDGTGIPCYNGNISSMTWKTGDEQDMRGFRFAYDELDRLTNAEYGENENLSSHPNRFNEQITGYDKMGNILGLKRSGRTAVDDYGLVDNLSFKYSGNQLQSVKDNAISSAFGGSGMEFKDGADETVEYEYDANGNLIKDLNKKITNIEYNYLNLPSQVLFADGNKISYLYDADGTKLRTVHIIGKDTLTTDYCDNVIYENGIASKLLTEVGYVTLDDNNYHYFIQDHQGNNRVVVDQDGTVDEVNHYYPFGGVFASTGNVQPYKYNGKELDRSSGLDWYDYGARHYDAALGRWHVVDPMAEKYYSSTPYNYCDNDPIGRIDPDGADWRVQTQYNEETEKIEYHITVNAVLFNNSIQRNIDMQKLATNITEQVNSIYSINNNAFVSKMDFNLRVVNSVDEINESDHILQIVNQTDFRNTGSKREKVAADSYPSGLGIRLGTDLVSDILAGRNSRTVAHELGHTGGLGHLNNDSRFKYNLMMQAKYVKKNDVDYNEATLLNYSQIRMIRDNYIHNRLHQSSPLQKNWWGKKRLVR